MGLENLDNWLWRNTTLQREYQSQRAVEGTTGIHQGMVLGAERMKAKGISGWQSKSRVSWDQYGRRQSSHIIEDLVG